MYFKSFTDCVGGPDDNYKQCILLLDQYFVKSDSDHSGLEVFLLCR